MPDVGILHCGELPHHKMGIKVIQVVIWLFYHILLQLNNYKNCEMGVTCRILTYNDLSDRPRVERSNEFDFDDDDDDMMEERREKEEDDEKSREERIKMEEDRLQLELEKEQKKQEELEELEEEKVKLDSTFQNFLYIIPDGGRM